MTSEKRAHKFHTDILLIVEVITGKCQTEALCIISRPRSDISLYDRTDEVNKLFITWPFHHEPEPAIN